MKLFFVAFVVFLTACSSLPDIKKIPKKNLAYKIHFVYEKWHTSILISASTVEKYSQYFHEVAKKKSYIRFGWGDGDYFTGKNKSFFSGARALVASDYSAIQVLDYYGDALSQIPEENRVTLLITEKGMRKLIRYMDNSLLLNEKGQPIELKAYEKNTGQFYQASRDYGLLSNCNTWSSLALKSAGIPIKSRFKLTAQSVFEQAKQVSNQQSTCTKFVKTDGLEAANSCGLL